MRFQYRHPKIYDFLIGFLYPKQLYEALRVVVGRQQSVCEVAAGYGRMARYLDSSNTYDGFDRNEIFVKYGRKQGLDLAIKDMFDPSAYKNHDIFLLVDIVHHLTGDKMKRLADLVFAHTNNQVVVVEPSFVNFARRGIFSRLSGEIMKVIDYDGFNRITKWLTHEEYTHLFDNRFDSQEGRKFSVRIKQVGGHYLVTYQRVYTK